MYSAQERKKPQPGVLQVSLHFSSLRTPRQLGQRFINEDVYYGAIGHEIIYRQQGRAWLIVDADCDYQQPDFRLVVAATAPSVMIATR